MEMSLGSRDHNDLNKLDWIEGVSQEDYSTKSSNIEVYFKNLKQALLRCISEASAVVGCVAWLTLPSVLDSLSKKAAVSILVQKEDWLRPDFDGDGRPVGNKIALREAISKLPCFNSKWFDRDNRLYFVEPTDYELGESVIIDPVRCVGRSNTRKTFAHPRMHHKFLVFCGSKVSTHPSMVMKKVVDPYAVWTGSFNVTSNATRSFENAVLINDRLIADAYLKEWAQLMAFSEPLDWTAEDVKGDMNFVGFWLE